MFAHRPLRLALTAFLAGGAVSCPAGNGEPGEEAVFEITACRGSGHAPTGETFRVLVQSATVRGQLDALLGQGNVRIVTGALRAGDGGFNAPWSWHLDPASVQVVQNTIELCDGCPSFVEQDLPSWLGVGQYCPWTSEVSARIR